MMLIIIPKIKQDNKKTVSTKILMINDSNDHNKSNHNNNNNNNKSNNNNDDYNSNNKAYIHIHIHTQILYICSYSKRVFLSYLLYIKSICINEAK